MRRVVLVRPSGPRNVGAALRAAANFGPVEFWLVAPERPSLLVHPDFEQMAHGVEGLGARVEVVEKLPEALADCTLAIGFTGRVRDHQEVRDWRELRDEVAARGADEAERVALVFGNEVHGLVQAESDLVNRLARIPTSDEHGSLNLAAAATLVLYDTFLPTSGSAARSRTTPVDGHARAYLKAHVGETLAGVARSDKIREEIEASVERLFSRAELETRDARAWHAVMRALGNRRTPLDYDLGPQPASSTGPAGAAGAADGCPDPPGAPR